MALILLTIIFFIGGFLAILYSILVLLSMLKYSRIQKSLPEKYEPEPDKPDTAGPPVADAFCRRAQILLQNQRFDAALADCKRAIDINAKHAEAHTLWEHALEKEIPPELIVKPSAEIITPAIEAVPVKKKVKKVVKKIIPRKKVATKPVLKEKPEETQPLAEVEPVKEIVSEEKPPETALPAEKITETAVEPTPIPDEETPPEKKLEIEPELEIELKPVETKPSLQSEVEVEVEPIDLPAAEPEVAEKVEEKIEEAPTVELTPIPEVETPLEEVLKFEPEAEATGPSIDLEVEAEVEPVTEPELSEPEISEEIEEEITVARKLLPGEEEDAPLIPEDMLVTPKPPGESLLEEFDRAKLGEFEDGEAGAGDAEWTRYADKNAPELAKSKIDMDALPAQAVGLKETLSDLRQAEAYNLQGESNIGKHLYNNAIKDFSRALDINPNYVDALINRGGAYAQLGRFNDALMDFNQALKFEKKDSELYNKRGEVYMQNNMYDQSIMDFTAAIVLNPMFSDAYLNRGRAYSEKGMPDEAMADFNHAIKADSDHSFTFIDRAAPSINIDENSDVNVEKAEQFNRKGLADLESDKFKEAVENFTHAINLSVSEADSYINRGRAFLKLDKPDEAMADFNQAVLFDPLNAPLYFWRAQAWKLQEDLFNMKEDLKLSCEMGHAPACLEYKKLKSTKK